MRSCLVQTCHVLRNPGSVDDSLPSLLFAGSRSPLRSDEQAAFSSIANVEGAHMGACIRRLLE